jgi:uncharacterized membrane protein YcfT
MRKEESNMKMQMRWQLVLALGLVIMAVILHYAHYLIFGHPLSMLSFLGKKIAFVPLEVLFVTLIVHQLLTRHEGRIGDRRKMVYKREPSQYAVLYPEAV